MYGIFTYIWLIFMVNVGEYAIHGSMVILVDRVPSVNHPLADFLGGRKPHSNSRRLQLNNHVIYFVYTIYDVYVRYRCILHVFSL